jgi:hypothetical protein
MSEVSLMLQAAVIAALKAESNVTNLVAERIYDRVPPTAAFPYVKYGDDQVLDDSADCVIGSEVFFNLHVWSKTVGKPETKRIAGAIRDTLDEAALTIADHNLVNLHFREFRAFDDPDPTFNHGIVGFRALIDKV